MLLWPVLALYAFGRFVESFFRLDSRWERAAGRRPKGREPGTPPDPHPVRGEASAPPFETLLKPADVARRLGISRSWLYQAAKEGRIPCLRLGGTEGPLRFVEADLREWPECARAAWQPGDTARATLRRVSERTAA